MTRYFVVLLLVGTQALAQGVDLIAAVDPARDVVRGAVEKEDGVLRVSGNDALLRLPVEVPNSFRINARLRRVSGQQQMVLALPVGNRHAAVIVDWNRHDYHGLEHIDNDSLGGGGQYAKIPFETGEWYDLKVEVRVAGDDVRIRSKMSDQRLFDWEGKLQQLSMWRKWLAPGERLISIANWDADHMVSEYSLLTVMPIEGEAHPLGPNRPAVAAPPPPPAAESANPPAPPEPEIVRPAAPVPVVRVPPSGSDWPEFRGPKRLGISADEGLPVTWSDSENLRWKLAMPGSGTSSPIVWGDHIYVTCFSGYGLDQEAPGNKDALKRHLVCVNRDSGEVIWQQDMASRGQVFDFTGFRALHGYASHTPVADESGVYVFYGTGGAAAYTHEGALRWQRQLGNTINGWGTSASPLLFEDSLIIHADIESQHLIALNKNTGEELWRVATGVGDSWSTPCLAEFNGRHELIYHHGSAHNLNARTASIRAVSPVDGTALWSCNALENYLCPSPVVVGEMCYAIAYGKAVAIRLGGSGDVTDSHLAWRASKGSEICTPIFHDGHLYWAHQASGVAFCLDAATGRVVYQQRLEPGPDKMYASGILADGRIYYTSRQNGIYAVAAAPQFEQLAHNRFASDESVFNATPAVSQGALILRSRRFLYSVGTGPQ